MPKQISLQQPLKLFVADVCYSMLILSSAAVGW